MLVPSRAASRNFVGRSPRLSLQTTSLRLSQPRRSAVSVSSQYAAGGGGGAAPQQQRFPPQQQQFPQQPAYQQQQQQYQQPVQQRPSAPQQGQRAAVPPRRRVGTAAQPQQFTQQLTQGSVGGGRQLAAAADYIPDQVAVQRRQGDSASDMVLPRSLLMGKEVITRTTARRLGYVNQLFVDPTSLSVASLYLRSNASNILAGSQDHIMLASMRQISDVVLVHDELALTDPPANDEVGYYKLAGAEVITEGGMELGRVRDFLFDPDNGAISTIKYDRLGQPWVPQALLSCYSISWEDVVALGPQRLIVRSGTELRAIKENDGIADSGLTKLLDILAGSGADSEGSGEPAIAGMSAEESLRYRDSPAYRAWYAEHAESYATTKGINMPPPPDRQMQQQGGVQQGYGYQQPQQQYQQYQPPQYQPPQQPRALPPPQSTTFAQAVQPQQQQYQQQPTYQQALRQQQRQAMPAGSGGGSGDGGWGSAPPPSSPQQYAAFPPQQLKQQPGAPAAAQNMQRPPPQQRQQYPQPGGAPRAPQQQQPQQPQQPQQRGAPPQGRQQVQASSQPAQLPPQNGIPIFPTPAPPYRRRDADGNFGSAPLPSQQQQQQQYIPPPQQQQQQQQQQQGGPGRQQPRAQAPPGPASRQPPQQRASPAQQAAAPRGAPVVEPDAIIPGGLPQSLSSAGRQGDMGGGSSGGSTQLAEFRQL